MALSPALTRIKNNQITDNTIVASTKVVPRSITGGLLSDPIVYSGNASIIGNLTVQGTTTTVDTTNTVVADPLIALNRNQSGAPGVDQGFIFSRGTSSNMAFIWDEGNTQFAVVSTTETGSTAGSINKSTYVDFKMGNLIVSNTATYGNIQIGNNTIISTNTNGNINLTPNGIGNVIMSVANVTGNLKVGTNANITGTANITGNVNVGNIGASGIFVSSKTGSPTDGNAQIYLNGATSNRIEFNTSGLGDPNATTRSAGTKIVLWPLVDGSGVDYAIGLTSGVVWHSVHDTARSFKWFGGETNWVVLDNDGIKPGANATYSLGNSSNQWSNVYAANVIASIANITTANITTGNITTINSGKMQNGNSNIAITANGNVTITSTSTATLVVTATGANITGTANVSGNANVGNLGVTQIVATGNITGGNILTSGSGGNISGANVVLANTFTSNVATGTPPFVVNSTTQVANLSVASAGSLANGNSNVSIPSANGNVNINAVGNLTMVVTGTGANITGTANVSGNANVGNLGTATAVITTGNITTINSGLVQNGTSNVTITSSSNISTFIGGNATAQLVITATGANIAGTANVVGNLSVGGNIINTGNSAVNGGSITTTASTFGLLTANATTLNIGNAATTLNIGSGSGNVIVAGDMQVTGNDIRSSTGNVAISLDNIDVTIQGNLTVRGAQTSVGSNDLVVQDSIINLHTLSNLAPLTGDDSRDIGIKMHYYKSSDKHAFVGWANDSGYLEYYSDASETGGVITGTYGTIKAAAFNSNIATGTAPLVVTSTTQVANLNVAVAGSIVNGSSNITIPSAGGNATISVGGNSNVLVVTGTGANITGTANVSGNANVGNLGATNIVISNNANVANLNASATITATSNVSGGNLTTTGVVSAPSFVNGNSNVSIVANGNVTVSAAGTANVLVITSTGANISGTLNTGTGNANVGNLGTSGTVIASTLQSNIATGTAPLTVTSTTRVENLNVAVAGNLVNGNSSVNVAANSSITITATSNTTMTVTSTGANITGTANVSGNANVGNLGTATAIITTGNITTVNSGLVQNGTSNVTINNNGNVNISVGGNVLTITSTGANISGTLSTGTGNANLGNVGTGTIIATTANLTTINSGLLQNGTSNVTVNSSGNVNISVGGNVLTVTSTGANITGTANITSFANIGNDLNVVGNANIANINFSNTTITSTYTNGNLNLDANGTGKIVLNSSADDSNVIIQGNSASGWANLIYADAVNGRVGILTNTVPANAIAKFNATSSIIVPVGSTAQRPSVGTSLSGMIRFNTTTNNLEFFDGTNWTGSGSSFTVITADQFAGDGSTVAFTLSQNATSAGLLVMVNGIVQLPTTSYNVSGNTLTFTEAPQPGDVIDSRVIATTSTVSALGVGDTSVTITDTGSNGNLVVVADGNTRLYVNNSAVGINAPVVTTIANVSVGTSATTIDQWPIASYRSAKYKIQVSHASAGYEVSEVLVVHDGTTASRTAYGIIYTGAASLGSTSVTISTGNVLVQYTGANTSNTVRISAEYLPI